jgi:hypothetical protein
MSTAVSWRGVVYRHGASDRHLPSPARAMLLGVNADHVHVRCSSFVVSPLGCAVAVATKDKLAEQRSHLQGTGKGQFTPCLSATTHCHSPAEDRAVVCSALGTARPIVHWAQTLSCLSLLDPQVGGLSTCLRRVQYARMTFAFMLPSMIKGYRPVSAAPLGTTRET